MRPYCDNTQTPSAERVLSDEELIVLLDTLHQHQTEHRIDHEDNASTYEIGATKNGKERRVPISDSLQAVFDRIKALHEAYGIQSDYLIADTEGRVIAPTISKAMYRRGVEADIHAKSIHALRKTVSSKLNLKLPCIGRCHQS